MTTTRCLFVRLLFLIFSVIAFRRDISSERRGVIRRAHIRIWTRAGRVYTDGGNVLVLGRPGFEAGGAASVLSSVVGWINDEMS